MTTAVLLAAGTGRKLWPLTDTHPKALLPLANQPVICRLLDACAAIGIERTLVVAGSYAALIDRAVGARPGVEIVGEADPAGAAWSLRRLVESRALQDDLLVLHADMLIATADLATLVAHGPAVLVSALDQRAVDLSLPVEIGRDWITAVVDAGRLVRFLGHHREPQLLRSAGAFFLPADTLAALDRIGVRFDGVQVGSMPPDEVPVEQVINDLVATGRTVTAVTCAGAFVDIDKPYHLLTANDCAIRQLTAAMPERSLGPEASIDPAVRIRGKIRLGARSRIEGPVLVDGDLWAGDDVVIADGAILRGPVVVGDRTRIREYCHLTGPSSIGPDNVIAHAAEFQGLTFEHVYLYHLMEIYGVLGACVDIGAGTVCGTLRFDDGQQSQRIGGRRETPNDHASACIIGAYSRTGVNVSLSPGVKIGSYSAIGPGVVVMEDVPSRTAVTLKQDLTQRPWGPEQHGW